jgi:predicted dehydrogenase
VTGDTSAPVRTAVVGLGSVSFEHLGRLSGMPGVEVVGVCDLSQLLASEVAHRFGIAGAFTDHRRMLDELRPDVVHVLTPPQAHRTPTIDALEAGADVLVEKPAATSLAAYAEMRDAATANGRILCENYNARFTDAVERAIDLHRAGALGHVVAVEASFGGVMDVRGPYGDRDLVHFAHDLPGGALQNFVTHPVSLVLPFLGACTGVCAWRRRVNARSLGDDELRAILAADDACAVVAVTSNTRPPAFVLRIAGTAASVEVDVYNRLLELRRDRGVTTELLRTGVKRARSSAQLVGRRLGGRRDEFQGLGRLLEAFYAAVRGVGPVPISSAEMDAVNDVVDRVFTPEHRM